MAIAVFAGAILTATGLLAYGSRRMFLRILRYWPLLLLGFVLIGSLVIAVLHYQAELWLWFKTLNWTPSGSGTDFMSYVPIWWEQALIAAGVSILIILLPVVAFKQLRTAFWGWGILWTIPPLAVLAVTLFFIGPYIVALAMETPEQVAKLKDWALPKVIWTLSWIGLIFGVIAGTIALWRSNVSTQEKLAGIAALVFLLMIGDKLINKLVSNYDGSGHEYTSVSPPEIATTAVLAPNTSKDCPGIMSSLQPVSTEEVTFNPKGCYFYSLGTGTVEYAGLFLGTLTVDLETGAGDTVDGHKVYTVRSAGGPVQWQYILCAGPKRDMKTLDCS